MAKIKTTNEYVAFLYDIRNAIDNVIGENKYYKRLAMSRPEVTVCEKCSFFRESTDEYRSGICGCYGCPCYMMDISNPDRFFCQMGTPKED